MLALRTHGVEGRSRSLAFSTAKLGQRRALTVTAAAPCSGRVRHALPGSGGPSSSIIPGVHTLSNPRPSAVPPRNRFPAASPPQTAALCRSQSSAMADPVFNFLGRQALPKSSPRARACVWPRVETIRDHTAPVTP